MGAIESITELSMGFAKRGNYPLPLERGTILCMAPAVIRTRPSETITEGQGHFVLGKWKNQLLVGLVLIGPHNPTSHSLTYSSQQQKRQAHVFQSEITWVFRMSPLHWTARTDLANISICTYKYIRTT